RARRVEVGTVGEAGADARGVEGGVERLPRGGSGPRDRERAAGAVGVGVEGDTLRVVLGAAVEGQRLVPRPFRQPARGPFGEVGRVAAKGDVAVHGRAATGVLAGRVVARALGVDLCLPGAVELEQLTLPVVQ